MAVPCGPSGQRADMCDEDPGFGGGDGFLPVFRQSAGSPGPGEGSLDDPPARRKLETLRGVGPPDDLDGPVAEAAQGGHQPEPVGDGEASNATGSRESRTGARPLIFPPTSKPRLPPLPVVFTHRLSITPAVGLASRPSGARAAITGWVLIVRIRPGRASHGNSAARSIAGADPRAACATGSPPRPCGGSRSSLPAGPSCAAARQVACAAGRGRPAPIPGPSDRLNIGIPAAHGHAGRHHSRAPFPVSPCEPT